MDFHPISNIGIPFAKPIRQNCSRRTILGQSIILFDPGTEQPELAKTVEATGFLVLECRSISDMERLIRKKNCGLVIVDLDNPLVNNRVLGGMKRQHPALQIIGVSSRPFHPELKEALMSYIYACISKPVDLDELNYLVKSIFCAPSSTEENPAQDA
jgi:DNA-binding NtrC family response regulator